MSIGTLEELKDNIRIKIDAISEEELMWVNANFLKKYEICVAAWFPTSSVSKKCDYYNYDLHIYVFEFKVLWIVDSAGKSAAHLQLEVSIGIPDQGKK